jgi:hypothetical protein
MKKPLLVSLLLALSACLYAQTDVQLLYHFTKDGGEHLTSTVEMFKTDNHGSNYFFVDFDYGASDVKGVSGAYWEISRGIKFWKSPFEIHVEYDGGLYQYYNTPDANGAHAINDAWLFGGQYTWNTADFSKIFTLQAMFKTIRDKNDASFQITGVWTLNFFKNKLTASGFLDFWREDNSFASGNTRYVMVSQPQFWYNFDSHISVGSEIDLGCNFAGKKGFDFNPTVAAKWTF